MQIKLIDLRFLHIFSLINLRAKCSRSLELVQMKLLSLRSRTDFGEFRKILTFYLYDNIAALNTSV